MTILPFMVMIPDNFVRNIRINPDIENETKTYFNEISVFVSFSIIST